MKINIVKVIKKISYNNKAEIYLINGMFIKEYENKDALYFTKKFGVKLEKFIEKEAIKYWEKHLMPIMKKNKWFVSTSHIGYPILIYKDEENEWDNIKHGEEEIVFESLCLNFTRHLNEGEANLRSEYSDSVEGFQPFISHIPQEYLLKKEIFIEI